MRPPRAVLVLLACGAALAVAAPNEPIIDAAAIDDTPPAAFKSYSVRWPYTVKARFTIDQVGRTRQVTLEPADAPTEVQQAMRGAVERWRFWPALGACRYLEQDAVATVVFEETRVRFESMVYEPIAARRSLESTDFAWLTPADAGDRRARPRAASPKLVDPVALKQVMPRYPAAASRAAQPGLAWVLFEVGVDGKPTRFISNDGWADDPKLAPLFAREAVAAVRQWRFLPATLEGKPQPRLACQRFMFNMSLGKR